ncbi:Ankyrin Repeat [Seminavis robusta]|uniref:Ankyrin Repeat n=1 Tax=Seminavis robusta TaxID=568900 RepID=A0A9N8H992_9STRA|nr:Ankyrin Repeat [Seminavis robusta]|eukprot:Sro183_g079740.1 Ankyrin Repeat (921) ;mRNA; r:75219-77981
MTTRPSSGRRLLIKESSNATSNATGATTSSSGKKSPTNNTTNNTTSVGVHVGKSQKHFEQLRRLILSRDPCLEEIQRLVELDPLCVQQRDPHHSLLALHWSIVFQNDLSIIQYLCQQYPQALTEVDNDGRLPLHHACRPEGSIDLVAFLLQQNSKVATQRDHRGKTPLHCASMEGVPSDIPRLLLQANPPCAKIRTRDGQTPLFMACDANAPNTTIQLLVDAYPEAVKYLQENTTGKFKTAKDYLAFKVRQTEQEADRQAAEQKKKKLKQVQNTRYEPDISIKQNATSDSDKMRRILSEEERQIQIEEQEQQLTRLAKQERDAALQLLEQQELDVEEKAKELDRLIQQKEAQLDSERFHKETQRIYNENNTNINSIDAAKRQLNDSGIGRSRSFNGNVNTQNLPPAMAIHIATQQNANNTTDPPKPETLQQQQQQQQQNSFINTPSVLSSSRGVSVEFDTHHHKQTRHQHAGRFDLVDEDYLDEDDEDDAYFDSLRHSSNTDHHIHIQSHNQSHSHNHTQPLYQESKVHTGDSTAWMPGGGDPSVDSSFQHPMQTTTDNNNNTSAANPATDDSNIRFMDIRDPAPRKASSSKPNDKNNSSSVGAPIQDQLQHAMQMLEQAEDRRKEEIKEAQEQQSKMQQELAKLMEKLEVSEKSRAAAEQERKAQELKAQQEAAAAAATAEQEANAAKQRPPKPVGRRTPPATTTTTTDPTTTAMVRGYFSGGASQSFPDAPTRISTTAESSGTYTIDHSMGGVPTSSRSQFAKRQQQQPPAHHEDASLAHSGVTPTTTNEFLKDSHGRTPLHVALANGPSYTVVQFLLQQFPLAIFQTDEQANTPLHAACSCPSTPLEILQLLLDIFPAATLMSNAEQQLPLHLACQHHGQRVEVLQLLLDCARTVEHDLAHSEGEGGDDGTKANARS